MSIVMVLLAVVALLAFTLFKASPTEWKEGDVIFQISKSSQSPYIQFATLSPWSHCGIVIEKNGEFYVLEASNVVKLTPIDEWINRGKYGIYRVKTIIDDPIKIKYSKYLGKPYDLQFKFDNDKWYCSELVYVIYKEQFEIELGKPKQIKEYNLSGLKKIMKKRGMNENQCVIAPSDIL